MRQRPDGPEGGAVEAIGHLAAGQDHEQAQVPAHELAEVARQKTGGSGGADGSHDTPCLIGGGSACFHRPGEGVDSIGQPVSLASCNYVAMFGTPKISDDPGAGNGVFYRNSRTRSKDITDGLSNTLFIGDFSNNRFIFS